MWRRNFHFESQKTCVCEVYYCPLLSNFFIFPEAAMMNKHKGGQEGEGDVMVEVEVDEKW